MAQYNTDINGLIPKSNTNFEVVIFADVDGSIITPGKTAKEQLDAFGRLRVSNPITLFDSTHNFSKNEDLWNYVANGAGISVHQANQSSVILSTTANTGDFSIKQSKEYFRYQPGKSQLILATYVCGGSHANNSQKIGYFDNNNGVYYEYANTTSYMSIRSNTSGTIIDNRISQTDWNLDKLDGTGKSGITLNPEKAQILLIDLEWLGVGIVRTGFVIDGSVIYAHQFNHANLINTVYMQTAQLPVRYEVINSGATANSTHLKTICATVVSEGGYEQDRGKKFSISNGVNRKTISTTLTPILSIKPNTHYSGVENRIKNILDEYTVYPEAAVLVQLIYNGTLTNASWSAVSSNSGMLYDTSANNISGGRVIDSVYIPSTTQSKISIGELFNYTLPITINYHANSADVLTISAQTFTSTTLAAGTFSWRELI